MSRIPSLAVLTFLSLNINQMIKATKLVLPYDLQSRKLWAIKAAKFFNFSSNYLEYYNFFPYNNHSTFMDIFCKFCLAPPVLENYEPAYALKLALLKNRVKESLYFYSFLTPQQKELIIPYFKLGGYYSLYSTKAKRTLWLKMGKDIKDFPLPLRPHHINVEELVEKKEWRKVLSLSFPNQDEYYSALGYLISLRNQEAFDIALINFRRRPQKERIKELWLSVLRSGEPNFFDHYKHYLHLYLNYPNLPRLNFSPLPRININEEEVRAVYYGANPKIIAYFYCLNKKMMKEVDISKELIFSDVVFPKSEIYFQIFLNHPGNIIFSKDLELIEIRSRELNKLGKRIKRKLIDELYFRSLEFNMGNKYAVFRLREKLSSSQKNKLITPQNRILYPRSVEFLQE